MLFVFEKTKKTHEDAKGPISLLAAFGHFVYSARLAVPYTMSRDPAKKSPGLEDVQLNKLVFFFFLNIIKTPNLCEMTAMNSSGLESVKLIVVITARSAVFGSRT